MAKMKMPKMNFDFTRIKNFLLEKGERVALGVCGVIALLLIVFTFMGAMGSGKPKNSNKPYDQAFTDETKVLQAKLNLAEGSTYEDAGKGKSVGPSVPMGWPAVSPVDQNPFFVAPDQVDTKRRQPMILLPHPERISDQVVQGGYYYYNVNPKAQTVQTFKTASGVGGPAGGPSGVGGVGGVPMGGGVGGIGGAGTAGAEPMPVKWFRPARMVILSGVFNMKAQMEAFRSALRHPSIDDLVAAGDIPRPTGLIVWRAEKQPSGWTKWEKLYDATKTGETRIDPKKFGNTYEMFRTALFDTAEPRMYGEHAYGGTMTWLPQMGNMEIPAVKLDGINVDESARKKFVVAGGEKGPMGPPGAGPGGPRLPGGMLPGGKKEQDGGEAVNLQHEFVSLDKFPTQKERLLGKLQPFITREDMMATPTVGGEGPGFPGVGPGAGGKSFPGFPADPRKGPMGGEFFPGKEGSTGLLPPDEILLRFVDADVYPGRTYRYAVQVRFANPNHGKSEKEVAFKELTSELELTSKYYWEIPRDVTIPSEFHYYLVDEAPKKSITGGAEDRSARADEIPIQLHSWNPPLNPPQAGVQIGDWAIAERLLIRRGEYIGRQKVKVEIPTWEPLKNSYRVLTLAESEKKGKFDTGKDGGIPIDFSGDFSIRPSDPLKYALVDFDAPRAKAKTEAIAAQVLILTPEGKLVVRDSQADTTSSVRTQRVSGWRKRIEDAILAASGDTGGAGGGGLPGVK